MLCCVVCVVEVYRWSVCSRFSWVRPRCGCSPRPPSAGRPPPPDRPKFRAFFNPLPPHVHSFFPLLVVLSWNFGGVFGAVHVWALGLSREDPQEREERKNIVTGEGKKKREILGPPPFGAHPSGLHFSFFGPLTRTSPTWTNPTRRDPHPNRLTVRTLSRP